MEPELLRHLPEIEQIASQLAGAVGSFILFRFDENEEALLSPSPRPMLKTPRADAVLHRGNPLLHASERSPRAIYIYMRVCNPNKVGIVHCTLKEYSLLGFSLKSLARVQGGKSSGLIATPEVVSEVIGAGLEFAILATDGLWDVIDDQVRAFAPYHRVGYKDP